jgi:uncharacterized protein
MSDLNPQFAQILMDVFIGLRYDGCVLGVGDLLAAVREANRSNISSLDDLQQVLQSSWCCSPADEQRLKTVWGGVIQESRPPPEVDQSLETSRADQAVDPALPSNPPEQPSAGATSSVLLPIITYGAETTSAWPMPRMTMVGVWRRFVQDSSPNSLPVLDVKATVQHAARQGIFLRPVYRRQERNDTRLVIMVDQRGSMTPLHRRTRALIDTAQCAIRRVEVVYFHNIPDRIFQDALFSKHVDLERLLVQCSSTTGVLIISDAGAARGHRRWARIQSTNVFLQLLRLHTNRIAWLNLMPRDRWLASSAEQIAEQVPMFQVDAAGLGGAVAVVGGRVSPHRR